VAHELDTLIDDAAAVAVPLKAASEGVAVITCRSSAEIEKLRRVNQLVAQHSCRAAGDGRPGVTTQEHRRACEARVREAGAQPAFKGYHGYPATVCASINEQVVHGIPSNAASSRETSSRSTWGQARWLLRRLRGDGAGRACVG
jgi:methionyl aminopeptidase